MDQNDLYENRFAPITCEIGFLECDSATAVNAFRAWQQPIQAARGVQLQQIEVYGDLPAQLQALLPLTSVEARRFLFLPTASRWTAFMDNGWQGTDVFSAVSYLAMTVGCRGTRAVSVPHTIRQTPAGERGRYGATMFELYDGSADPSSLLNIRRSISAANDGGSWRFDANGTPLDFERLEQYNTRRIRDRFNPELLRDYLAHLGIFWTDPAFYDVSAPALLVSKQGPMAAAAREYSLEEARSSF